MDDELLVRYQTLAKELADTEAKVLELKTQRSDAAKALFERDGKGHVYELDGEAMLIVASKTQTYFFTPKDKWKKKGGRKAKAKKAIVDGKVVEVQTPPVRTVEVEATLKPAATAGVEAEAAEAAPVAGPVEHKTDPVPPPEPTPVVKEDPKPATPAAEDDDPLAAALAEIDDK